MSKSLFARGLTKIKRKKDREQKKTVRGKYMEYVRTLPVDRSMVLLEARNGRAIDGNIYYILRELLVCPDYQDLKLYVVVEDPAAEHAIRTKISVLPKAEHVAYVTLHSQEYYRVMASAGTIINDATIGNFYIKKEGQVYLNVWHGTPLKTMGRRVLHEPHATGNVQKNFICADYLLYPSEYMMEHMIEDYMIADVSGATVLLGGYPRNIAFFDESQRLDIRGKLAGEASKIYAYMPTWRPGDGGQLQEILQSIDQGLAPDEMMYVNVHPLAKESVDLGTFDRVRPFPEDTENYALLNAADALLTDYSSVFYDYAVTGRKIVLFTYDEEEYFATRGLYEPIHSLPFPQVKTVDAALSELRSPKAYDDGAFLQKYCPYESADAAKKICRQVLLGEKCMEERSVPSNGKPNILVYGGDLSEGARTDQTFAFLADPEKPDGNYYLTFNRKDLKERFPILFDLPEGIRYIGRAGTMWMEESQQEADARYQKGRISFDEYWGIVRPAFELQRKRCYGDMRIDRIVQIPEGKPPGPDASEIELEFSTYEL